MKYYIGAYATSPCLYQWNPDLETHYFNGIKKLNSVKGLEHPFWGSLHKFDDEWFLNNIKKEWDYCFTCIPGTMVEIGNNPHFGLASDEIEGRIAAIEFIKKANNAVNKLNNYLGREAVNIVQLHSAPNRSVKDANSSKESFYDSLSEIVKWNWYGANLVVEHCDAWTGIDKPEKGFLGLEDEIATINQINFLNKNFPIGIFLNWGRSVIEGKNTATILEHIKLAVKHELLKGLFFSGVTDKDSPWGIWKDTHMPPPETEYTRYFAEGSLMTFENIKNTFEECANYTLKYIGIKLLAIPNDSTIKKRVGINRDAMNLLDLALNEIKPMI